MMRTLRDEIERMGRIADEWRPSGPCAENGHHVLTISDEKCLRCRQVPSDGLPVRLRGTGHLR